MAVTKKKVTKKKVAKKPTPVVVKKTATDKLLIDALNIALNDKEIDKALDLAGKSGRSIHPLAVKNYVVKTILKALERA